MSIYERLRTTTSIKRSMGEPPCGNKHSPVAHTKECVLPLPTGAKSRALSLMTTGPIPVRVVQEIRAEVHLAGVRLRRRVSENASSLTRGMAVGLMGIRAERWSRGEAWGVSGGRPDGAEGSAGPAAWNRREGWAWSGWS